MLGKRRRDEDDTIQELAAQPLTKKFALFIGSFFSSAEISAPDDETFDFQSLPTEIKFIIIDHLPLQARASLRATNTDNKKITDSVTSIKYYDPFVKFNLFDIYIKALERENTAYQLKPIDFDNYLKFVQDFSKVTEEAIDDLGNVVKEDLNLIGRGIFYFFGGDAYRLINSEKNIDSLPKLIQKCEQFDSAMNSKLGKIAFGGIAP